MHLALDALSWLGERTKDFGIAVNTSNRGFTAGKVVVPILNVNGELVSFMFFGKSKTIECVDSFRPELEIYNLHAVLGGNVPSYVTDHEILYIVDGIEAVWDKAVVGQLAVAACAKNGITVDRINIVQDHCDHLFEEIRMCAALAK